MPPMLSTADAAISVAPHRPTFNFDSIDAEARPGLNTSSVMHGAAECGYEQTFVVVDVNWFKRWPLPRVLPASLRLASIIESPDVRRVP